MSKTTDQIRAEMAALETQLAEALEAEREANRAASLAECQKAHDAIMAGLDVLIRHDRLYPALVAPLTSKDGALVPARFLKRPRS